jgi:hypothetical protein
VGKPEVWDPAEAWPFGFSSGIRTSGVSGKSIPCYPIRNSLFGFSRIGQKLAKMRHKHWREPKAMPFQWRNSLYFSLLTGIWINGEQFALDWVHRHKVHIINNLRDRFELLVPFRANSREFGLKRDWRAFSFYTRGYKSSEDSLLRDPVVPFQAPPRDQRINDPHREGAGEDAEGPEDCRAGSGVTVAMPACGTEFECGLQPTSSFGDGGCRVRSKPHRPANRVP